MLGQAAALVLRGRACLKAGQADRFAQMRGGHHECL